MSKKTLSELTIHQLPSGTIFKIGLISNISFWGIIFGIMGIFGAIGFDVLSWNDESLHGFKAVLGALLFCLIFTTIGSVILMLGGMVGRRLVGKSSFGKLTYIDKTDDC